MSATRLTASPRQEERDARARLREEQRREKRRAAERERREQARLAAIIREELARDRAKRCRCAINARTSHEQLLALGAGCTAGRWVCPTLDAIRRRARRSLRAGDAREGYVAREQASSAGEL